ncbi:MAG: cupin domain-containing protein [Fimbriimonas sp.]
MDEGVRMKPLTKAGEVEAARSEQSWGTLRWLASKEVGNAEGMTLGRVRIVRGASNPRHCHPNCAEVLYLLSGRLEHTVGDATYTLEPGDTLAIPAGAFHNATSTGDEDADMIVAYDAADREFVLERP